MNAFILFYFFFTTNTGREPDFSTCNLKHKLVDKVIGKTAPGRMCLGGGGLMGERTYGESVKERTDSRANEHTTQ
jgi:hypothetical protein